MNSYKLTIEEAHLEIAALEAKLAANDKIIADLPQGLVNQVEMAIQLLLQDATAFQALQTPVVVPNPVLQLVN